LVKTVYEKNFIVVEAKKFWQRAVENSAWPETIDSLVEGCQSKNGVLAEIAIGYLGEVVKNIEKSNGEGSYFMNGEENCVRSVNKLIKQIKIEVDGKRMKMKK
jgi:arabinogalactan endo-1,4-beta-galactosidase